MITRTENQRNLAGLGLTLALVAILLLVLLAATVSSGAASTAASQALAQDCTTTIGGDVTVPTTWTLAGSPYCLQPGVDVPAGVTLTVEPGVTVYFITYTSGLTVSGGLIAIGTPAQPITFTSNQASPQPGDWSRLYMLAGSHTRLEYADISYGGHGKFTPWWSADCTNPYYLPLSDYDAAAVWVEDYAPAPAYPDIEIRHSRLHNNRGSGLYFYGQSCDGCGLQGGWVATVEDTQVDHNTGVAICENSWLDEEYSAPTYHNLTLSDNGADALVLSSSASFYMDRTLDGQDSFNGKPTHLINGAGISIRDDHVLTIAPGTTVLFSPWAPDIGSRGDLYGDVIAEGTPAQPITFTSGAPLPQVGDWAGLRVKHGQLAYCDISHVGPPYVGTWGREALRVGDDVSVRRCNIHDNDTGVKSQDDVYPFSVLTENDIHHNRIGVILDGTSPTLRGNNIYGNSDYGLTVFNEYWVPDARYNWWGHPSGPYHPVSNPSGLGDRLEDYWWQGYQALPVMFTPWRTTPGEGAPPALEILSPADGAVLAQLPQQFRLRATDPDEGEPLYFRVEIYAGYALMKTYDQSLDPAGWDRASYTPGDDGAVTATLNLPEALPNGDYTWQATVSDGWHDVTTPRQPFQVSLSGWGIAGVTPAEPVATPNVLQTLSIRGTGFTAGALVWLEQARYDGEVTRLEPAIVQFVSSQRIDADVDLIGRSGPWQVVVSQGGQTRRTPLYVLPYLALTALDYMNEPQIIMNHITAHDLNLSNFGTAAGVAVIGVIVPTGTQVLLPNQMDPQMEYLGEIADRTHLYAVHLAAQENRVERLYFQLPQSAVNLPGQPYDPTKWDWGDPLRFKFWVLAQPTEEGWQVLRQETDNLQDLINGAIWGSALIEGWAIDQYAELADEAAAGEYIERLGARYPFIADALVMRQLQEFQLLADLVLDIGDEPASPTSLSAPVANTGEGPVPQDGEIGEWVKRQIGDPWSFLKGFMLQANEDGIPWDPGSTGYERGTLLVAEGEGLMDGLTFGLYKPRIGYWNYYHINGKEQGLVDIGHPLGNFLSIPLGAKLPGEVSKGGISLVRKAAAGLKPGGDRYWSIFKLTVEGDVKEPARLGLSVIWKGGDDWVSQQVGRDYNLIHWGDNPSFGGSHWGIGWTRQPVIAADGGLLYGANNEVAFGSGIHVYTNHGYIPYKWAGKPFGEVDISTVRHLINYQTQVPVALWRSGMLPELLDYPANFADGTACGDGSQDLAASWDPNDIAGWPQRTHIRPTQPLEFLIRFENVATATLPAETVTVTLPLHPNLDWDSMQLVGSSHPQSVTVKANPDDRTLAWAFPGIDLPPNVNPPEGEGWVRVRIAPSLTLTSGQQITAQASIVFDQNEPIRTNVLTYTIDFHPPLASLAIEGFSGPWPLVHLAATDNPGGAGVDHVGLFYSSDNANWVAGRGLTSATSTEVLSGTITFIARSGHYWLRAAATDLAGNNSPLSDESIEVEINLPFGAYLPLVMRHH
jgi:methionine-rich copper-binding protein CopC